MTLGEQWDLRQAFKMPISCDQRQPMAKHKSRNPDVICRDRCTLFTQLSNQHGVGVESWGVGKKDSDPRLCEKSSE